MALGRTDIANLREKVNAIRSINNVTMMDCWNTFQYITRNLDSWANETVIGNEMKQDLNVITQSVRDNIDQTERWLRFIEQYATEQEQING